MNVVAPLLRARSKKEVTVLPLPTPPTPEEVAEAVAAVTEPIAKPIRGRVREWIRTLHRDPSAEEIAAEERRARLLEELNRAVADAPDDVPIRDIVARLNHHIDD
jgi:hypothetical protein